MTNVGHALKPDMVQLLQGECHRLLSTHCSQEGCWHMHLPVVLWELLLVVIDPEEVKDLVAGACSDMRFKHRHVNLPKHVHEICNTEMVCSLAASYVVDQARDAPCQPETKLCKENQSKQTQRC